MLGDLDRMQSALEEAARSATVAAPAEPSVPLGELHAALADKTALERHLSSLQTAAEEAARRVEQLETERHELRCGKIPLCLLAVLPVERPSRLPPTRALLDSKNGEFDTLKLQLEQERAAAATASSSAAPEGDLLQKNNKLAAQVSWRLRCQHLLIAYPPPLAHPPASCLPACFFSIHPGQGPAGQDQVPESRRASKE